MEGNVSEIAFFLLGALNLKLEDESEESEWKQLQLKSKPWWINNDLRSFGKKERG